MVECKVIKQRVGFRSMDSQTVSRAAAETETTQENIQDWLQLDQGNLRVQLLANKQTNKTNSLAWVRERTITAERPPLLDKVSANLCG
jgi:hypothetical protein